MLSFPSRLVIHESKYDEVLTKLKAAYTSIRRRIGDPLEDGTLYGPLHSQVGVTGYLQTLEDAKAAGGVIECGGGTIDRPGNYVEPTIITGLPHNAEVVHRYFTTLILTDKLGQRQNIKKTISRHTTFIINLCYQKSKPFINMTTGLTKTLSLLLV